MRLKKAYGLLSLLFFLFLGVATLSPWLHIPSTFIGGVGTDIGAFLQQKLGILSLSIPTAGILLSLGLITGRFFRSIVYSTYLVVAFFIAELVVSLWMNNPRLGGSLALLLQQKLKKSIGSLGSSLLIVGLFTSLLIAMEVDRKLKKIFGKSPKPPKQEEPPSQEVKLKAMEDEEEKEEPQEERGITSASESKPSDQEEVPKIVEGGGELARALSVSTEVKEKDEEESFKELKPTKNYKLPPVKLLDFVKREKKRANPEELQEKATLLESKLKDFGVSGKVVSIHYGPVVSMFEYKPAPGVKVSRILNLQDDIAVVMKAGSVRVVAPIPGKDTIGIEIPNNERETVYFSEVLNSKEFQESKSPLTIILGKDIFGKPFVSDLRKMPHLLVAGATGSGKSVGLNTMICSLLYKATPDMVKLILVDPKMLEFSVYNGIPHLITPVITDPKKASTALNWAVSEMERRYKLLTSSGVRNIERYNLNAEEKLPYIVIFIDELADLMMVAGKDVEIQIARLAQKARAAGIHLVVATQRPSVDVITGLIKANFPSRIAFKVSSKVDSRTILDTMGAEKLLGNGDMLFMPPGKSELIRLHGAFIGDKEIEAIAEYWKRQAQPVYREDIFSKPTVNGVDDINSSYNGREDYDELYDEAVEFVCSLGYASASLLQRHFKIGYNRAARLIEMMEKEGIVGPAQGSKPREVLKKINKGTDSENQS